VALIDVRTCEGPGCVNVIPERALGRGKGRRRVYCSRACQERAYRQRQTTPSANEGAGLGIDRVHEFTPLGSDAKGPTGGNLIRPGYALGTPHKPFRLDADVDDPDSAVGATASEADSAPLSDRLVDAGLSLMDFLDAGYVVVLPRGTVVRNDSAAPFTLPRGHEYSRKAGQS
jgi:hypothetical protein